LSKQEEARDRVLDLIESLSVGQAIPSERHLTQEFGVSRLTVRAALDELVRDGYLDRRHGSGTYVTEPKIAQPLTLTSFSEEMRRRGMVPGSRTLELTTTQAGARLARRLQVSPSEPLVRIRRLRLADAQPMAMEVLHVPQALVPGLTKSDLENHSFYELLQKRYAIVIASGTQTIEPTVTNEEESEVLGVPLHTPAFLFERTTVSESGRIVEFVRSIYRGDRYRLVADLVPQRSRNGRSAGAQVRPEAAPNPPRRAGRPRASAGGAGAGGEEKKGRPGRGAQAPHSTNRGNSQR
jgi:GntR family transcriptional regulator